MALAEVGDFEAAARMQREAIAAATGGGLNQAAARMRDNLRCTSGDSRAGRPGATIRAGRNRRPRDASEPG